MVCAKCKIEFNEDLETSHIKIIHGYGDDPDSGDVYDEIYLCRDCAFDIENTIEMLIRG